MPFSADHAREEAFALGVIGAGASAFPDTLRQFRAHGAPRGTDSLSPVHTESEETPREPVASPWRPSRFWTSLAVGFGVGACAALLLEKSGDAPPPPAVHSTPAAALRSAAPPASALPGCAATPAPAVSPPPVTAETAETKAVVTPVLERRFWLAQARSAQHNYRLSDAERFYRRALAQAPRDSEALSGLGELELLRGEPTAASARFREALEANSDYVPARVALADLSWQAGRAEAAREAYRQLVEQYSADLLPAHVSQRLEAGACVPQCAEALLAAPEPALEARH